jgi:hypothetical protein
VIEPGEYLIVWTDNDGSKCPRPPELLGDGQDCPDPNDSDEDLHANFALDAAGDQIYLFRQEENGFGVVHGVEFGPQELNVALSLTPDCTRTGEFRAVEGGSPGAPNPGSPPQAMFFRGDANGDCVLNITDPTFTLNYLFLNGPEPPCLDAADADDTGIIQLTDAVYALNYLFQNGPEPEPPGPTVAGPDPSMDTLAACGELPCGA